MEVARLGGMTVAASQLGLAKSAVSKYVTRLEERLGLKLFERTSRSVRLTTAGKRLHPRIESIVTDMQLLMEQANDERSEAEGIVHITATQEFGSLVARELFPRILQKYPKLRLAMTPSYKVEDLHDPIFDLAFRFGKIDDDRLVVKRLGKIHHILLASPEFLTENPINSPIDLAHVPTLFMSHEVHQSSPRFRKFYPLGERNSKLIDLPSQAIDVEIQGPWVIQSSEALLELAKRGHGVTAVPLFMLRGEIERGELEHCLPNYRSQQIDLCLVYREGASRVRRTKAVIEMVMLWVDEIRGLHT